uniref:Uncharacterized protein n=1 Tax=Chloropicon primus TaxID=1764295 RepID=A0A7S2X1C8_9CHLO
MFTWPLLHSLYVYLRALHSSARFTHSSIDSMSSFKKLSRRREVQLSSVPLPSLDQHQVAHEGALSAQASRSQPLTCMHLESAMHLARSFITPSQAFGILPFLC